MKRINLIIVKFLSLRPFINLICFIFLLVIIFPTTTTSKKPNHSNFRLFLTFLVYLFLAIFLGRMHYFFSITYFKEIGCSEASLKFFTPYQQLALDKCVVLHCMEYDSHIWGDFSHTALKEKREFTAYRFTKCFSFTNSFHSLFACHNLASLSFLVSSFLCATL